MPAEVEFARIPHPNPASDAERATKMTDPVFGAVRTDHMVTIAYSEDKGWHNAQLTARGPLPLDPASAVFHYAQEIFEGMKAYRGDDGTVKLFRPEKNAQRFQASARRLAMPELPEDLFITAVEELVKADEAWVPTEGSLYLRPFLIATEGALGVRPSKEYMFVVIACPVGNYFKGGSRAVTIWASTEYRALCAAAPALPSAVATMPPAWQPRPKRPKTVAIRCSSSTRSRVSGSKSWAA